MKRKTIAAALAVLLLSSCSLFKSLDVKPAMKAANTMALVFANQTEAFRALVEDPTNGMSAATRAAFLDGMAKNAEQFAELHGLTVRVLEVWGDLTQDDWQSALTKLVDLVSKLRAEL